MAFKLDMSKTYDRVEWSFLEEVMRKLRFNERWINFMMICVNFVSYSILVNRGICQGDPLSPFLFLLCIESLHSLIPKADNDGSISRGFSLCRRSPRLTHLLFANNSLLFCRSNRHDYQKVLEILAIYESASGKQINRRKTSIFFSQVHHGSNKNEN